MKLVCTKLGKRYGNVQALKDVTLRCGPGMLGLVGPNRAGKTTLMRMIATLLPPTEGSIQWDGEDVLKHGGELRQVLGYLPQEFGFYPEFSGRQFLRYLAAMKGLPKAMAHRRVDEVLEWVHLEKVADRKLKGYSGGMKQRIGISQALLNDPVLLIVDEPTVGLDPEERVYFRQLLAGLQANRVIILSTHIISDVEAVADRLVILREGRIFMDATPEQLIKKATGNVWNVVVDQASATGLQERHQVSAVLNTREGVQLRIVSHMKPHGSAVPVEPSLEDAYLLVVGKQAVLETV